MKRMFLASSFKDVAELFQDFANEDLSGKSVAFIPTASLTEKRPFYVKAGRKALERMGLIVNELEISRLANDEIDNMLQKSDLIYISGGNTFFLLQELKKTKADKMIVQQVEQGKIYIGESAGAIVATSNIEYASTMDSPEKAPGLESFSALKLTSIYPVPHHTNFPFQKAAEKIIAQYDTILPLCPISNREAITIAGDTVNVVSTE